MMRANENFRPRNYKYKHFKVTQVDYNDTYNIIVIDNRPEPQAFHMSVLHISDLNRYGREKVFKPFYR